MEGKIKISKIKVFLLIALLVSLCVNVYSLLSLNKLQEENQILQDQCDSLQNPYKSGKHSSKKNVTGKHNNRPTAASGQAVQDPISSALDALKTLDTMNCARKKRFNTEEARQLTQRKQQLRDQAIAAIQQARDSEKDSGTKARLQEISEALKSNEYLLISDVYGCPVRESRRANQDFSQKLTKFKQK